MPLTRRVPKRGFHPPGRVEFQIVNVGDFNTLEAHTVVDPDFLKKRRFIKSTVRVKILGNGVLTKSLHVKAHAFSSGAKKKIQEAKGKVEVLPC